MQTRQVLKVEYQPENGWWIHWTDGGLENIYHIKPSELDYRAAEYGIDPEDSATVLDIILHERVRDFSDNVHDHPRFVYNTDEASARENMLGHIADVKAKDIQWQDPNGLLDQIHQRHPELHDSDLHKKHRAWCAGIRAERMARSDKK